MEDPLQLNLGDRDRRVELIRRAGPPVAVRAYPAAPPAPPEEEQDDLATLMHYVWVLWQHKWILLAAGLLGALTSMWFVLRTIPMYHAKATLEILKQQQPFGTPVVLETSTDTQIQVLTSRKLRGRALSVIPPIAEGKVVAISGQIAELRKLLKMKDPVNAIDWGAALQSASDHVMVTRPKENGAILEIQTDSPNPEAAAAFVNSLSEEFVKSTEDDKLDAYFESGKFLTGEQQKLKAQIEDQERRLAEFAREKGLIFTDSPSGTSGTQTVGEETLKKLQTELQAALSDQVLLKSKHPSGPNADQVLTSPRLAQIDGQIGQLRADRSRLTTTLSETNDRVLEIDGQIATLTNQRQEEKANILLLNKQDEAGAAQRVELLQKSFDEQSQKITKQSDDLIKYKIQQRNLETDNSLYTTMLQQGGQSSIASAMRNSSAKQVDTALVQRAPITPDLWFSLGMGMLTGLCVGAGFVIVRSRADLTVHAPGAMEHALNLRELGVIPSARSDKQLRNLRAFKALPGATTEGRTPTTVDCLEMVASSLTPSSMAEAFRSTMTSLLLSGENGDQPRVLVFTSASPGEGKTTVVSNLAISLAQISQRVLLIDADMRLPRAHQIFDVPNNFGLSDVLNERRPIDEYVDESLVRKTHIPNLYLLPAGPARTNLSRLFHSTRMNDLLTRFREMFDIVLIDTAPVLVVPDSRILARRADAVVLVVRAHQTHQAAASAAANRFSSDGTRILGTILNDWNPNSATHSYGGYYSKKGYTSYYPER